MEDDIYERLRRQSTAQRVKQGGRRIDLRYRPSWRPTQPDHLDRLVTGSI